MHQIIIQHFSANLKRLFREIIVSSHNPFSYRFYRRLNIVHYNFSTNCIYFPFQLISFFFCPKPLVHNDINTFLGEIKCNIP